MPRARRPRNPACPDRRRSPINPDRCSDSRRRRERCACSRRRRRRALMAFGEPRQIEPIRDLLCRPFALPMLPDVVQDWKPAPARLGADRIEQRIIGPAARQELDADRPARRAPIDLVQRVIGVIRVHGHEHPHAIRLAFPEREHGVVAERHVGRRGEIGRRREAPRAENRRHVIGHADALAGAEPGSVHRGPIGAAGVRVMKVRVGVDQRPAAGRHACASSSRRFTSASLAPLSINRSASSSCANAG